MTDTESEHPIIRHLRGVREVVINTCHGGFSLSHKAILLYHELQGQTIHWRTTDYADVLMYHTDPDNPETSSWRDHTIPRDDPYLVAVVRELGGGEAGGPAAMLKIVEIPANVEWIVQDYDGLEWIAERHRIWQ
jgi:hypothetical protein